MNKKLYFINSSIFIFTVCYQLSSSSVLAQTDSIVNERIPVKAEELEEHWNVDCTGLIVKAERFLDDQGDNFDEKSALQIDMEKCMHIYNTPDSAHYRAEPDYNRLLDQLKNITN